ncbi:MAG: nickel pincer cofactor biosynthesis protein LarC [Balneolaceae bacterium]|nr:MAG: nickel pincer cofactor biosynthesis protein LarC [Balneolaceae bacterium]
MKILYYDCFAGISGDMHLGAMIDAGVDPDYLISELNKLNLTGYKLHIYREKRKSIEGTKVDVILDNDSQAHNHHGHGHHHHDHEHHHHHDHDHGHAHSHKHDHHHHEHRNFNDIKKILANSELSKPTINRALKMFSLIAEAEAKIHGVSIDDIHFHEVGAVDSILDITGAAICLEYLKPDKIFCSTIELGGGMVKCAHGLMPVPAPATSEILKGIPVKTGGTPHEATTPSGAAILAANVDEFTDSLSFRTIKTAYGIGHRDMELPNILRVHIGETDEKDLTTGEAVVIECNIDDMNPEYYSHVMDQLFSEGALDVYITPVIMKKSRPAVILSVIGDINHQQKLSEIMLRETTTLGIRSYKVSRLMFNREMETVNTSLGAVTLKKAWISGMPVKWKPEHEDCKRIAVEHGLSLQEVYKIVEAEITMLNMKPYEN